MYRRYIILICLLLVGCGGLHSQSADRTDLQSSQQSPGATLVYECNGYDFIARRGAGEMALWLQDGYVVLPQAAGDSGTVYEDGDVSFWSDGDEAMLTVDRQTYQNCHQSPQRVPWEDARLRGVDFRGIGNEPGWYLEIRGKQLLFVGQYGAQRVMVPEALEENLSPVRAYGGITGTHELRVEIVEESCTDTMGGETFPSRVTVILDGTSYQGCGQALEKPWE